MRSELAQTLHEAAVQFVGANRVQTARLPHRFVGKYSSKAGGPALLEPTPMSRYRLKCRLREPLTQDLGAATDVAVSAIVLISSALRLSARLRARSKG